jgi:hypothetical protein
VNPRPQVARDLARHGITPEPGDTVETVRDRLNDVYLEAVRAIRERQRAGEIAKADYARHVERLRDEFSLLALPLELWEEP